jgi:DNA-binding NtrC family response regulator
MMLRESKLAGDRTTDRCTKGEQPVKKQPLRVLVVDDEPLIRWALAETLSDGGDLVTQANTGAAAVRALNEACEPIDVVMLDYKLPDVRNLSLLAAVRRLCPDSRVIVMSAYSTPDIAEAALALGATRVIAKPFDMRDVADMVHDAARPVVTFAARR